MRALVKFEKGSGFVELRDVAEPVPGPGEVLIEVKACGICGTDLHIWHDQFPYWPPVTLGHEFSGSVAATGPNTHHFHVGDRVVAEPHSEACGQCYLCRSGQIHICPTKRAPGWGVDGGFAKYVRMPERLLHHIPDHLPYDVAAVVEPAANGVHDLIERARLAAGDFVVVVGPGPIGLLAALAARAGGARRVVIVGTPNDEPVRLKKARELGFDAINIRATNPVEYVLDLTHGIGADIVVEASGAASGAALTPHLLRTRGCLCAIGMTGQDCIAFPYDTLVLKACDAVFCRSTGFSSWDRTIQLIANGALPAGEVITHRLPLDEWRFAFEEIEAQRALKILLMPGKE